METFKNEEGGLSDELFWILETLFAEADAYCHDPELRGEHHIDQQELRMVAREAESELKQWLRDHTD